MMTSTGTKLVSLDEYVNYMGQNGIWGDGVMVSAATLLYCREVIVISGDTQQPIQDFGDTSVPSSNCQINNKPKIVLGIMKADMSTSKTLNHYVGLVPAVTHSSTNNLPFEVADRSSLSSSASASASFLPTGFVTSSSDLPHQSHSPDESICLANTISGMCFHSVLVILIHFIALSFLLITTFLNIL